ncbi:MAG TPA: YggS family pyridoxal phosphate-dependent enzyme [Usitatibacter sp.]|nr:YggS family pyridoxal phosphate-dependent enzyme [Usitatibacter sp.]
MSTIAANLQAIRRRISEALQGDSRAVTLVAVSKSQPPEKLREARGAGCRDFGESYVQEALPKIAALAGLDASWHFVGRVQTNKARDVAEHFDWVHAVDRPRVAAALSRARPASLPPLDFCIQVNISAEATKGGVAPGEALALAREVRTLPRLRLRGLMGMARHTERREEQRAQFEILARTRDEIGAAGIALDTLSMGMSDDFEAAIEEGSTMVRIGTAIFGARTATPAPTLPRGGGSERGMRFRDGDTE